jgi:hypothetical protein
MDACEKVAIRNSERSKLPKYDENGRYIEYAPDADDIACDKFKEAEEEKREAEEKKKRLEIYDKMSAERSRELTRIPTRDDDHYGVYGAYGGKKRRTKRRCTKRRCKQRRRRRTRRVRRYRY